MMYAIAIQMQCSRITLELLKPKGGGNIIPILKNKLSLSYEIIPYCRHNPIQCDYHKLHVLHSVNAER